MIGTLAILLGTVRHSGIYSKSIIWPRPCQGKPSESEGEGEWMSLTWKTRRQMPAGLLKRSQGWARESTVISSFTLGHLKTLITNLKVLQEKFLKIFSKKSKSNFKQQKQKHIVSLRNMCMMPTLPTTSQRTHPGEPGLPWVRSRWDGRGPCKREEMTLAPFKEGESRTQHQEQLKSPGIPREDVLRWAFEEALGPTAASGRGARYLWGWQPSPRCSATAAGLASAGRPRPRTAGVWGSRTRPSGSAPCGPVSWPVGESHGQLDVMHGQGPPGQLESLNDQPHPLYHLIYCPNDHVASFNHGKWE